MSKPLTDEIKLTIRDEFVHGFIDENGTRKFPSIDMLVSRHDVARATLYRAATKEDWQKQKNQYQSELQVAQDRERMDRMLDDGRRLDDNAIQIAHAMLSRVGRKLQQAISSERDNPETEAMTPAELRELSLVAGNAQKIGKLALGQAQEIAKVSADVSNPEAFNRIMEQLDEVAEQRASQDVGSVH